MKPMEMKEVAAAVGAEWHGDGAVATVSTDTRSLPSGCLFIALKGERFDGHAYLRQALEQGAAFALAEKSADSGGDYAGRVLWVKNTRQAYLDLASYYRKKLGVKVVAVTGSVGKTTTKEMTACALSPVYHTLKTEANLNNEVGLAQTIFRLEETHGAAVLEMGMDGPGQIAPLSRCAAPDLGIVTNIGVSHLEAMGSRDAILAEKMDITVGMPEGAPLLLNGDNDLLRNVRDSRYNIQLYGIDNMACAIRAEDIREFGDRTAFRIRWREGVYDGKIPCLGRHNIYNALSAFGAAVMLGVSPGDALDALKKYEPAGMRQKIVAHNSYTIVEDCYNASPDSMRAALTTLGAMPCERRRIAVLSDMLELGAVSEKAHYDAGALAAGCGTDILVCTGELAREYARGAKEAGMKQALHFSGQEELFDWLKENLSAGDTAWFKASRGMRLEQVIARIYKEC